MGHPQEEHRGRPKGPKGPKGWPGHPQEEHCGGRWQDVVHQHRRPPPQAS